MKTEGDPAQPTRHVPHKEPDTWMRAAAVQIFHDMGIQPFDEVISVISAIIAKHYALRETEAERGREYLAKHAIWLAEQKAKSKP